MRRGEDAILSIESFEMSNLTTIQSIVFESFYFSKVQSFELNGLEKIENWKIDLPKLQIVQFNDNAFQNATSFEMSNLPSLQSIEIGQNCFSEVQSFLLTGKHDYWQWRSDLPHLQRVRINDNAFQYTTSFAVSILSSLQSIEIGQNCFIEVQSFSLNGKTEE